MSLLWLGLAIAAVLQLSVCAEDIVPVMSDERVVFQLDQGDFEFGFYPEVAPVTAKHIFTLVTLGCYTSNHIFRVDKNFVAQTADVSSRSLPMSQTQREWAVKTVPLEVVKGVKHHEGVLSMGRYDDPNSGTSSFSILLGDAQHLDMQYTIFAKVTQGMDVVHKLEELPTRREGIFVMPLQRIDIRNTYWFRVGKPLPTLTMPGNSQCAEELEELKERFINQEKELQKVRKKCLPS